MGSWVSPGIDHAGSKQTRTTHPPRRIGGSSEFVPPCRCILTRSGNGYLGCCCSVLGLAAS